MAYGGISQHPTTMRGGGGRVRVVQRAPRRPVGARQAPSRALVKRAPVNVVNTFNVPAQYALGDGGDDDFAQFGGFSLKGIAKAVKKVASPIQKAAASVGHTVGNVVTSKVGQGILGGALALTGVGAPAAAGIFAATKGVGNLIKPGGNIKHAVTGAAQGAIEGVVAVGAGKAVRAIGSKILNRGAQTAIQNLPSAASLPIQTTPTSIIGGDMTNQVADAGAQAAAQAAAQQAAAAAQAAAQQQAQQVADLQAQLAQAQAQANDAAAAQLAQQVANAQAQAAAAAQATQAANAAAQGAQSAGSGVDLSSYVQAAQQAAQAAAAAAQAPPTAQGTAYAQQAADAATDASADANAGAAPEQASILGGNPLLVGAVIIGAVVLLGGKKRKRQGAH